VKKWDEMDETKMYIIQNKIYTEEDWLNLSDNENAELIDGALIMLAAPSWKHQKVSANLTANFHYKLKGSGGDVYHAPCGIKLNENTENIYEPDLFVVCKDLYDLDKSCNIVRPSLIIEILSPSTGRYDKTRKLIHYINAGVEEIWIIDILDKEPIVTVYLKIENYNGAVYKKDSIVDALNGIKIDLKDIFDWREMIGE
jgi:Uma2 family endonuclease